MEAEGQSWEARHAVASETFVPWLESTYPLQGRTILEYGSGRGAVSCAFAQRAGRLIGYDIDAAAVEDARGFADDRGLTNTAFEAVDAAEIFDRVRSHSGQIDVFLLYAVLEHLTLDERLEALELSREVIRDDGVIVVIETPNRLVDTDYHTSQLPFFDQLPIELALRYADRSPRAEFADAIGSARADSDGGALALARWGTGVSFHEFELVFGDLRRHVISGGYDPALLAERTIHPDEVALARYLDQARPDLPPPFSRYWLDMVLSPAPVDPARVSLIRPWKAETTAGKNATLTAVETIAIRRRGHLKIRLPVPTTRIVCTLTTDAEAIEIEAQPLRGRAAWTRIGGRRGYPWIADLGFDAATAEVVIRTSRPAHIQFVGYEVSGA